MIFKEIAQSRQTSYNKLFSHKSFTLLFLLFILFKIQGQELNPKVTFSSYYGNIGVDDADVVTVDSLGNTYLGCHSNSQNLPGIDKYPYTLNNGMDAFVIKLDNEGNDIGYITQMGGSKWEAVQGVISDSDSNIYVIGTTFSSDFPADENSFQRTFGGRKDAFVVKINAEGKIVWSTFLGGSNEEDGRYINIDQYGNVYVVGWTASKDFPTTNEALQPKSAGGIDAFIAILNSDGKILTSTYLGGSGDDIGFSIKLDSTGQIYIGGTTSSIDFPVKNAIQSKNKGDNDAFLAVINKNRSAINFATYWGGEGNDQLKGIDFDSLGNIYTMGFTHSLNFPITQNALQKKLNGGMDIFISKFNIQDSNIVYSTYLGGNKRDRPRNFATDLCGNAYIVGKTSSDNFPTTSHTQSKRNGEDNAFITLLDKDGLNLLYSTLYGGNGSDTFEGIAMGADGSVTVSGLSSSTDFPLVNPIQKTILGGRFDIIVARFILTNKK
ncbi:SBBP repeat-containing protein [Tenacibaculum ovolyticum]|uniref:SBBP repeat-containing protein n=1 Tax=Tenacibaculum ovolyticum TaxID=104270 RepID=UPI00040D9052|nr:SBBP repeat-containing protein [Tenacibaculum ovolyticum]